MNLAWKLKRVAMGLRQLDVAARAKISQSQYCHLERGDALPTDGEREAIEAVLRVPEGTARELTSTFAEQEVSA